MRPSNFLYYNNISNYKIEYIFFYINDTYHRFRNDQS